MGGGHAGGGWVNTLPPSWIPYVQLCRLNPPIALLLVYLPHVFGVLHAARVHSKPGLEVLGTATLLLGGSFFFSNAAHAWNDLVDAPIDRRVTRTKTRPIARGAVTPSRALVFISSQALLAATFLLWLPGPTTKAVIPTIIATAGYPWAKRYTYFPQAVLGFCLAWGVIVGCAAAGTPRPWFDAAPLALVLVSALWTVIYDTVYAHQDLEDDLRAGVKSTAVRFRGGRAKPFLWLSLALLGVCIIAYGQLAALGAGYHVITLGGCVLSLGRMIAEVKLGDKRDCWGWFTYQFWPTGVSIMGGLLYELVVSG
ncbi:prenyltransferase [Apiospora hydei]|uniref:Prenyltransferase n=1 Tax=Apiospora hydei TaxID=1337664 RepID=A0ABR1UUA3_9PEZI